MRAVVADGSGGPEVLRVIEVPDVEPGAGEVAIEVAATAVNRADLLQRKGFYPPPPGASEVIGLECSGTVAAIGEGVTDWQVGDEVCALLAGGGYASRVVCPAGQVTTPAASSTVNSSTVNPPATAGATGLGLITAWSPDRSIASRRSPVP